MSARSPAFIAAIETVDLHLESNRFLFGQQDEVQLPDKIKSLLRKETRHLSAPEQGRVQCEFLGFGPLEDLLEDPEVSEIMLQRGRSPPF